MEVDAYDVMSFENRSRSSSIVPHFFERSGDLVTWWLCGFSSFLLGTGNGLRPILEALSKMDGVGLVFFISLEDFPCIDFGSMDGVILANGTDLE
jgi:hypothetical protein